MDIRCPKCGEPLDMDCRHERAEEIIRERYPAYDGPTYKHNDYDSTFKKVSADFRRDGCPVLGGKCSSNKAPEGISVLYDLLGDDMDGAAAMIEDMESMLDFDEE